MWLQKFTISPLRLIILSILYSLAISSLWLNALRLIILADRLNWLENRNNISLRLSES